MKSISIAGDLGSGKSSVAKVICEKLGYEYFSTGVLQRKLAAEKGLNTLELNYLAEKTKSIDDYIDAFLKQIDTQVSDKRYVLDSRLAWHFVPSSFKVYLTVSPQEAARRVSLDKERSSEPTAADLEGVKEALLERQEVENRRFKKLYNIDCRCPNNYDAVIDTTQLSREEVAERIIDLLRPKN